MLLAIDTSTNYASLALADGAALLAELNWRVGQRHGAETLERARWLLRGQGVALRQLDGIAVATGPGSFNGLRVAMATAKTLAFALEAPLYGIPTLDIIGWGARLTSDPIWALLDAGRGEVFAACYQASGAATAWAPLPQDVGGQPERYFITTPQALAARCSGPVIVTGEWREAVQVALAEALGGRAHFTAPLDVRRGAWLAELASARARCGDADDPRALEPLYVRRPNITTSARATPAAVEAVAQLGGQAGETPGGGEAAHAL